VRYVARAGVPEGFEAEAVHARERFNALLQHELADVAAGQERISQHFANRELWRKAEYKTHFAQGKTEARCAWCERFRDQKGELHVDHHRPKSAVSRWKGDPPEVGDDPPAEERVGLGFWWMAWRWDNFVLACWTCNARWKRDLFPRDRATAAPLLLHPHEPFVTREHFRWNATGHIQSVSSQGYATIVTCGLNRGNLVSARRGVYADAVDALDRLIDARRRGAPGDCVVQERRLELLESREFPSMIRWLVEDRLGMPAEEFFDAP
jgi:5-methylcytosine-specific restriction endonuclease McrA